MTSVRGRHFAETLGAEDCDEGDHGVVAKVKQKTGEDGAGAGSNKREDDADRDKSENKTPGPAKLGAVHQAEEDAGDEDACAYAEVLCKQRIKIAAKNGFFDEGRDQYCHGHKEYCGVFVAEKLFDGHILGRLHFGRNDEDHDGKTAARKEEEPWAPREPSPSQSSPEGRAGKDREADVEKEENQGVQKNHAADGESRP